jgi:cytochrome P450
VATISAVRATRSAKRFRNRTINFRLVELLRLLYRVTKWPVVRIGPIVFVLGSAANRFVLTNFELFRWGEAFEVVVPLNGPTALLVSDGETHRRRRRQVQPTLHSRQVEHYLTNIADNADAVIQSWQPGERVDLYLQMRLAVQRSTTQLLFGRRLGSDDAFFDDLMQPVLNLVDHAPFTVTMKRALRTPQFRSAMAARKIVDRRVYAEIDWVRRNPSSDSHGHLMNALVHGSGEAEDAMSDLEIRDQVVSLIAAGSEPTSGALAWAVYALLSTPGLWDRAAAEVRDVVGGRAPDMSDLRRLRYLNGVVQETLRVYPPVPLSARKVVRDFEFDGHRIKAGSLLIYSPYVTHRLPELWPDPTEFRPERWDQSAADYRKPGMGEFLPFSAGPHRCVGAELANAQLMVMLARLLTRTTLHLPVQSIRPISFAAMRPKRGLLVDVEEPSR